MSTFTDSQKLAIAADGNVLVSAGAGTGKTRTVVERCLRLIDEGCSLENILMVTFTEAAAAEMRARLRRELEQSRDALIARERTSTPLPLPSTGRGIEGAGWSGSGSQDVQSTRSFPPLTPALSPLRGEGEGNRSVGSAQRHPAGAASLDRIEEQLALLDTAHISTLHSFCLQLVRDHFHELDIDPQVSVLEEAQTLPLLREVIDALLGQCYRGQLEFAVGVQNLIRNYGGGSDERIRALVWKLHRYTQSLPPATRWYERELERLAADRPEHWREWLRAAFSEWRDEWLPVLEQCEPCENISSCVHALRRLPAQPTADEIRAATECVRVADAETDWPDRRKTELRKPVVQFFEEALFFRSLVTPREGRDPLTEDWDWMREPMRALLLLAQKFTEDFAKAKRAQGGVDFADLEQLALRLLVDERGLPTETARAWQAKFEHVFVDECQDVNAAQDAIICAVSRAPGNRFLVGDVKQSIYRFRLADPGIFRRYEEEWRDGQGGQRIPLADNFRSRESILQFINPLFAALMRPSVGGVSYDADAQLRFGNPEGRATLSVTSNPTPRVELHLLHKVKSDESGEVDESGASEEANGETPPSSALVEDVLAIEKEARLVARRLRELRENGHEIWDEDEERMRPVDWRDMVVLLRSPGTRVEAFAKEFSRAGVPLSAARAGFYSAIEVLDLLNLLKLLDNPLQDIPLAAVLRSPLVGLSLDELAAVRIAGSAIVAVASVGVPPTEFPPGAIACSSAGLTRHAVGTAARDAQQGDRDGRAPQSRSEPRSPFFAMVNRVLFKGANDAPGAWGESARGKLAGFFKQFERWRVLVRQTSLSHCLETVLAETHYEALLLAQPRGRERVANVHRLLELARQYDPFQRQGLYRFLRFVAEQEEAELDQDAAIVETANAVRLMSIHKSKGLEFPIVVLACLAGQFNTQDLREDILLSAEYGLAAKIIPPHIEQRYPSLPWWLAKRRETRELLGEEMRLLYVAMTRARDTLVLTAFDKSKQTGERWSRSENSTLSDRAVVKAQSYFAWLRLWLGSVTADSDWKSEQHGQMASLRWQLYPEDAPEFASASSDVITAEPAVADESAIDLDALRQRLGWEYGFRAATTETAKTNVSVLRRRATEEDEDARVLFRPRRVARAELSAADIGSAHHLFLQQVRFERAGSLVELRGEAERLMAEQRLTKEQTAALDFDALLGFWQSPVGKTIRAESQHVHRELPFTARFTLDALRQLGLAMAAAADEFVVVQGVVDLVIVRSDSIAILDFKTDAFRRGDLEAKTREYAPQLKLYASALSRIYARPVTEMSLHFLTLGETMPISVE